MTTHALPDFAIGDPCAQVAQALAVADMWTPEQWAAAVALVGELRLHGLLAALPAPATADRLLPPAAAAA